MHFVIGQLSRDFIACGLRVFRISLTQILREINWHPETDAKVTYDNDKKLKSNRTKVGQRKTDMLLVIVIEKSNTENGRSA